MFSNSIATIATTTKQIIGHPTWDIILIFLFIAIGFFYGISSQRRRLISTILYTYVAILIHKVIPVQEISTLTGISNLFLIKTASFLLLFILLYFSLVDKTKARSKIDSWWPLFTLSFLQVGLLLHAIFGFLPADRIALLSPIAREVFAQPRADFWWFLLPLLLLFIMKRNAERK